MRHEVHITRDGVQLTSSPGYIQTKVIGADSYEVSESEMEHYHRLLKTGKLDSATVKKRLKRTEVVE